MNAPAGVVAAAASSASQGPLGGHLWHIIEGLGFFIIALGGIATAEFVEARRRRRGTADGVERVCDPSYRATLLPVVAISSVASAGVHYVVMPEHFEEAALYGTFFLVAATSQLVYAAMVLARPSRALLAAGALGNLAIVVLWLITRTAGIPLGPSAGEVESVGGLDVLAAIFELTTAIAAIALIRKPRWPRSVLNPKTWSRVIWVLGSISAIAIASTAIVSPPS